MPLNKTAAITLAELESGNTERPIVLAKNAVVQTIVPRKNLRRFKFIVRSFEVYSKPSGHIVSLIYPTDNLPNLYYDPRGRTPKNTRVRMWCTCPAWQYQGAAYNSTTNVYNLDKRETRAPDINDPEREYLSCKHIHTVSNFIGTMSFRKLINQFAKAYRLRNRASSAITPRVMEPLKETPDYCSIEDLHSTLSEALPRIAGLTEDDTNLVLSNLNEENIDSILHSLGLLV